MMKRLLLFFLLLSAYSGQAQTYQTFNYYGGQFKRIIQDSSAGIPKDTFAVPVSYRHLPHIAARDTALYIWSPALQMWRLASAGGSGGVAPAWGQLTGPLSNQTDLQTALNAKQNTITLGTAAQYFRGNLTLGTFSTDVLAVTNPLYAPLSHGHNGLIPPGGLPGQILKKKSISDWDMDWYYEDTTASAVASVHGRTGAVTAQSGDYSAFYPSLTGYNKTNWDNAYSWGNHASAGYLTNITGKVAAGSNVTITGAGTTASPYTISASGGGSTYTAPKSVKISNDSIYLENETSTWGVNKVYGTNASGVKGVQSAAVLNLTSPANGDLLKYQDGQWVNYTPTAPGSSIQFYEWLITATSGQSKFVSDSLGGTHVRVWRERELQIPGADYTFVNDTITFIPTLTEGERAYVEASTASVWTFSNAPQANMSYAFSGASQSISVASPSDFNFTYSQPFSIAYRAILNPSGVLRVANSSASWLSYQLAIGGGDDISFSIGSSDGTSYIYKQKNNIAATDVWHTVVATYDGAGGVKVYLDGSELTMVDESVGTVSAIYSGGTFTIGSYQNSFHSSASYLDRLLMCNKALSASEVTEFKNLSTSVSASTLSFYSSVVDGWDFNNTLNSFKGTHNGSATSPQYLQ